MLYLNQLGIDVFIKRVASTNMDPHWNNYDLIIWKKDSNGYTNKKGMFRKNTWGISDKVSIDNKGIWKLPRHYVKYFK
jgi:hypothetical protein